MHIPDGYLSPATAGALYGMALPFWYAAYRKLRRALAGQLLPLMAMMSAFCFVLQMLNIPLPGGTTGHAAGASLAGIVLGPWPAVISVSIALAIQALFFGDGGITTLGANCFNMAIAQVFASYYIYSMISRGRGGDSGRTALAAAVAGFFSLTVSGTLAGIQLGLQPLFFRAADGTPLYAPYPLSISVPAMMIGHMLAGIAEAVVTAAGIRFVQRAAPDLLIGQSTKLRTLPLPQFWARLRLMWVAIGVLVILTPLGLLAPGTAWGEWSGNQLRDMGLGFIPSGLANLENSWTAAFPDYGVPGAGEKTGYVLSAVLGVLFIVLVFFVITVAGRKAALRSPS